jgi:hypothetical protein
MAYAYEMMWRWGHTLYCVDDIAQWKLDDSYKSPVPPNSLLPAIKSRESYLAECQTVSFFFQRSSVGIDIYAECLHQNGTSAVGSLDSHEVSSNFPKEFSR